VKKVRGALLAAHLGDAADERVRAAEKLLGPLLALIGLCAGVAQGGALFYGPSCLNTVSRQLSPSSWTTRQEDIPTPS
jgi:hypothetical protein